MGISLPASVGKVKGMTKAITVLVSSVEVAAKATFRCIRAMITGAAMAVGVIPIKNADSANSDDHEIEEKEGCKSQYQVRDEYMKMDPRKGISFQGHRQVGHEQHKDDDVLNDKSELARSENRNPV